MVGYVWAAVRIVGGLAPGGIPGNVATYDLPDARIELVSYDDNGEIIVLGYSARVLIESLDPPRFITADPTPNIVWIVANDNCLLATDDAAKKRGNLLFRRLKLAEGFL